MAVTPTARSALGARRLHYGWVVAGVTFLTLLAAAGVRATPGVLVLPLEQEFGWNRATVSLAVSINLLLFGAGGPFAAAFMDRFGIRRVVVSALALMAAAVALTTLMQTAWQLDLLWGVLVGTSAGVMGTVLGATVANRWFVKRRGLVVGVLSASSATGQLIFLPIMASLAVGIGWRAAVLLVAGALLLVIPLVALFMRDSPRQVGLLPFGAEGEPLPAPATGNPFANAFAALRRATHVRDFWLLAGSFFICGVSTNGLIGTHLIPASVEHGMPEVAAAGLLAFMGIMDLFGTTGSGWLSDRFDNRVLLAWYYGLRGLSLLFLPYAYGTAYFGLVLFAVFYGLDWLATVPPTVRLSGQAVGRQDAGIVFGWIFASHQLGAAVAAFGAGALRTLLGDYQVAFMAAGVLCLIASGLVVRIGRAPSSAATPPNPRVGLAPSPSV